MRWALSASGNLLRRAIHAPAQGSQSRYLDASCSSRNPIYNTPLPKFQCELFTSLMAGKLGSVPPGGSLQTARSVWCVRFIGAFGRAETLEMWTIFGREKAALKRTQSKRFARFLGSWLFRRGFQVHASFCSQAGVRLQKLPQQHCIERNGN